MGESAEIASLRAEIEALKTQVMSMRSDMDVSGGAVSSSGTGGPVSGGYGTPWVIPEGYRLPSAGRGSGPHPFDIETDDSGSRLVRCVVTCDGKEYDIEDTSIDLEGSVWVVMEEGEGGEPSFSVTQDEPEDGDRAIRLYDFGSDGQVAVDYRHALVSFWGGDESSDSESSEDYVTSLNEIVGDVKIVAGDGSADLGDGKSARVYVTTDESGKRVVISLTGGSDADEPEDPCAHPGSEPEGGVPGAASEVARDPIRGRCPSRKGTAIIRATRATARSQTFREERRHEQLHLQDQGG